MFSYRVNGKQRWESRRTLDEARRAKSARSTDIGRGEFHDRSRVTLYEYARERVDRYQGRGRRGLRESTRDDYRRLLEQYALRYFGERVKLTEVSPSAVAAFVGWLCDPGKQQERELADNTVRNIVAAAGVPGDRCAGGPDPLKPGAGPDLPHRPTVQADGEDVAP